MKTPTEQEIDEAFINWRHGYTGTSLAPRIWHAAIEWLQSLQEPQAQPDINEGEIQAAMKRHSITNDGQRWIMPGGTIEKVIRELLQSRLTYPDQKGEEVQKLKDLLLESLAYVQHYYSPDSTTNRDNLVKRIQEVFAEKQSHPDPSLPKEGEKALANYISPERAQFLLNVRDALVHSDVNEAYHFLSKFYNPPLDKYSDEVWKDIEALAATEDHEKYQPHHPEKQGDGEEKR